MIFQSHAVTREPKVSKYELKVSSASQAILQKYHSYHAASSINHRKTGPRILEMLEELQIRGRYRPKVKG